jgi:hypothetical protein
MLHGIAHWFQAEYWPAHGPWWNGAIWGNVFVVPVAFILGAVFWPPLRRRIERFVKGGLSETERKLDHIILHHPDIPPLPPKEET